MQNKSDSLPVGKIDWEKIGSIFEPDKRLILEKLRRQKDCNPLSSDILKLLGAGMFIGLSVVFPVLPMAIAPFVIPDKKYKGFRVKQVIKRLKKQKLVEVFEENGQKLVRITQRGRVKALMYKLNDMKIDKPKVWDRKWRVVIFDISEEHRVLRNNFRKRLKSLGFYPIQKSVWVNPYPCFDQVEFLRQIYHVGFDVSYMIASKIENSEYLIDQFNLN